jgi:5,10-methylene-tetrahydrofolate dehydrogenase/methenyl tetrahydrofolate cyclohydrolase
VGEDPASATYVNNKMKAAREIGEIDWLIQSWIHSYVQYSTDDNE